MVTFVSADRRDAAARRQSAASRYQPEAVRLLLVAETPPTALDRYFYFDDVSSHDGLFRYVTKLVLGATADRGDKSAALARLRDEGVFLIDTKPDPYDTRPLSDLAGELVDRCRVLAPDHIILIKTSVYDAAFTALRNAGLPVVDRRVPFPGSGQQRRFEAEFALALADTAEDQGETDSAPGEAQRRAPSARPTTQNGNQQPTLHEEIARMLKDGRWRTTAELAALVNEADRYHKGDGTPVTPFQIHGRTRNYSQLFERDGSRVRLRP
jgi:hypothetical protein